MNLHQKTMRQRMMSRVAVICATLLVMLPTTGVAARAPAAIAPVPSETMKVHFLDVGQADSIFIELPDKASLLIDAGDSGGGSVILSYIKKLGYTSIDYVIATHPHADHIGGMTDVLNGIGVKSFYMPKVSHTSKTFADMVDAIAAKGLKINVAAAGKTLPLTKATAEFVAPVSTGYQSLNDYSAVLKLTYGKTSFLFTGDAEALSESQITANVNADVLKVGHHGSDTSTSAAFLKKVAPKYAIISVGAGNTYSHPAVSTVQALAATGATLYRTDVDGTVVFSTDGNTITVDKKASPIKPGAPPVTSSATENSAPAATGSTPQESKQAATQSVWVTATGKRYHRKANCGSTKSAREIPLTQATAMGLTACSTCY